MVISPKRNTTVGALATECAIALGILAAVMIPLSVSFIRETRLCRAYFHKAVALEIVDGEMEALAAGEWQAWEPGEHLYKVKATAATNLPPGKFVFKLGKEQMRLEWIPASSNQGGRVFREVKLR